jgi:hypothetical protein
MGIMTLEGDQNRDIHTAVYSALVNAPGVVQFGKLYHADQIPNVTMGHFPICFKLHGHMHVFSSSSKIHRIIPNHSDRGEIESIVIPPVTITSHSYYQSKSEANDRFYESKIVLYSGD